MKQFIFTTLLVACISLCGFSQQADPRLEDAFGASRLAAMSTDSVQLYNYIVQHGFVVMDLPDDKRTLLPFIDQLVLKSGNYQYTNMNDLQSFNRLLVVEPTNERLSQSFQIPNSKKALILPSMFQLKLKAKDAQ